ncbi:MAG: hypothetical protein AAFV72_00485 [Cyanobacteria bacterium J06635_1]
MQSSKLFSPRRLFPDVAIPAQRILIGTVNATPEQDRRQTPH